MPEYGGVCMNMPKSILMAFVLHFSISPFVLQSRFYFNTCYLLERLQETRDYSLKENETVFLFEKTKFIFFIATGRILFVSVLD